MKNDTNETLKGFRDKTGLTQAELARAIGMGLSAYQDLETGFSKFKDRHMLALERVSLRLAVERGDLNLAFPSVRRDALDFVRLLTGQHPDAGESLVVRAALAGPGDRP